MTINDILLPYQKTFLRAREKRKIWISSRQAGKSTAVAVALCRAALAKKNGLGLCISVNARSASEIVRKCRTVAEAVEKLTGGAVTYTAGYDHVEFSSGGRVMSLPSTSDALRGWTARCVCVDEAAFVSNLDDVLQAIAPTLTRDPDAELILASTPAGKNGPFYELWLKAREDPAWYTQTTTIHDAVKQGLKVDLESLRSLCPDPDVFAQEYECVFQSEFGAWLDPESLLGEDLKPYAGQRWLGIDVGAKSDASGFAAAYEKDGRLVFDFLGYMRRASFEEQLQFVRKIQADRSVQAGYVDAVGIGYGLSERIQKEVNYRIKPFSWTAQNKTPAYESFRADAAQKKIVFSREFLDMAKEDVRLVKKLVTPDGKVKYSSDRTSLGHGDLASAMVLCHRAWKEMPACFGAPLPVGFRSRF